MKFSRHSTSTFNWAIILFAFLVSTETFSATLGQIKFGGGTCGRRHFRDPSRDIGDKTYTMKIDLDYEFKTTSDTNKLERNTCLYTIPIKLAPNERIIVTQVKHKSKAKVRNSPKGQFEYEMSFVGGDRERLIKANWSSAVDRINDRFTSVVKSQCGRDAMFRSQISAFAEKGGEIDVEIERVEITFDVEKC